MPSRAKLYKENQSFQALIKLENMYSLDTNYGLLSVVTANFCPKIPLICEKYSLTKSPQLEQKSAKDPPDLLVVQNMPWHSREVLPFINKDYFHHITMMIFFFSRWRLQQAFFSPASTRHLGCAGISVNDCIPFCSWADATDWEELDKGYVTLGKIGHVMSSCQPSTQCPLFSCLDRKWARYHRSK